MEVFHYAANELKGVPIFSNDLRGTAQMVGEDVGACFNDIDFNPEDLLDYNWHPQQVITSSSTFKDEVMQTAVDHAVLEADRAEGILYDDVVVDHPDFDDTCEDGDEYVLKVARLVDSKLDGIEITESRRRIYEMRFRNDWSGPDSVYDAFLILHEQTRKWFSGDWVEKYLKDREDTGSQDGNADGDEECRNEPDSEGDSTNDDFYITLKIERFIF